MFVIQKSPPLANVPRNIRFTEELFDQLNKTAAENDVSFNSLVLQCCRYALNDLKKESGAGKKADTTADPGDKDRG